jgi:putative redox protein
LTSRRRLKRVDTVKVRWAGKRQFVGWDEAGHGVVMDASADHKGEGTGPRPIELVLYALAACTAMDIVSILEKKRQPASGLEIVVTGTQREDGFPHSYENVHIEYVVGGPGVTDEAVARAIELSEEKYCSVMGMFGPQVTVSTSHRVVERLPEPPAGA